MSEVEFRIGKAKEVCKEQSTFKEKVEELSRQTGLEIKDLVDDWGDLHQQMKYRGNYIFVESSNKMYQLIDDENVEEDCELIEASQDSDGLISYKLRWYNGGASFNEVFEEALNKLDNEN